MSSHTPPAVPGKIIRIAAALVCRTDGCTLLVRKRGTAVFMQPGGKIEPHESPLAALLRELREELALPVAPPGCIAPWFFHRRRSQ